MLLYLEHNVSEINERKGASIYDTFSTPLDAKKYIAFRPKFSLRRQFHGDLFNGNAVEHMPERLIFGRFHLEFCSGMTNAGKIVTSTPPPFCRYREYLLFASPFTPNNALVENLCRRTPRSERPHEKPRSQKPIRSTVMLLAGIADLVRKRQADLVERVIIAVSRDRAKPQGLG